jgi:hypothetical protein
LETLAQLLQALAALAHQALAALQGELFVLTETQAQGLQPLAPIRPERRGRLAEAGGQEGAEAHVTPLEVAKATIRLQLQGLLQAAQPLLQL